MANITVGAARFMVADVAGVRPSKNPALKSSLKDRQVFINVADAVMCVGIGGGDYIELDFRNAAGLPGPPGAAGPPGPPGTVSLGSLTQLLDGLPALPVDPANYPTGGGLFRDGDANGYRLVRILPASA